jgi:hypothetical protein
MRVNLGIFSFDTSPIDLLACGIAPAPLWLSLTWTLLMLAVIYITFDFLYNNRPDP